MHRRSPLSADAASPDSEQIPRVDPIHNVAELFRAAVGHDRVGAALALDQVAQHPGAEEVRSLE